LVRCCSTWGSWDWNRSAFPDPAAFTAWVRSAQSPVGHPLALTLNVHPQSGVDHCMERYLDFAARIGFDASANATSPCDMGNFTWVSALWDTYYSAAPLASVDFFWTDYQGVGGPSGRELLWSNLVYAAQREARAQLRPMTFSRWGGLGGHRGLHRGFDVNLWCLGEVGLVLHGFVGVLKQREREKERD
jgi:alpha-glucosidase (family GH31 glycosyl hydrolase)